MTAPRIVILGNDFSSLSLMHDLLIAEGYRTLRCRSHDVTDAHAVVKRAQADLVILDLWLAQPGDGWEVLKKIWADPATMHTGVVIMIGQAVVPSLQIEILRAMRCPVVAKPFDAQELLRAITAVLGPSPVRLNRRAPVHAASHADLSVPDLPGYPLAAAAEEAEMSRFSRAYNYADETHGYDVNAIVGTIGGMVAEKKRRSQ